MPGKPLIYQDDTIVASPAAGAETVVCKLKGVASRYGNAVKLSGWVNVTPDTDATAIVLRVRRGTTTGGTIVTPAETVGFGGSSGGGLQGMSLADAAQADAGTVVPFDGVNHDTPCLIAAPPAWMDNAGHITAAGVYAIRLGIQNGAGATVPGKLGRWASPFTGEDQYDYDSLGVLGSIAPTDIGAIGVGDLPFLATAVVSGETDVTASVTVVPTIFQLASAAAAGGGGVTPGDAVLDVIDLPGQIAQASYVLTAQMTGANSPSVINGVSLTARID